MTIFAGVCFVAIVFTLPETYAPIILLGKAKRLRKETGNENYYAPIEKIEAISFAKRVNNVLAKPFVILIREPMLIAITIYMSFVYGCLYLLFEAYPIVFTEDHHFNAGISGLMFLPLPVGGLFAVVIVRSSAMYISTCVNLPARSTYWSSTLAMSAPWKNMHQTQSPLNSA
jgi:hypothetical protein